jgi:hypothetical protein
MLIGLLACVEPTHRPLVLELGETAHARVGERVELDLLTAHFDTMEWDLGDGRSQTDGNLRYDAPGHYTAFLTLGNDHGEELTGSVRITITWPDAEPLPSFASTMVQWQGAVAFIAPESGTLFLFSGGDVLELEACDSPARSLAMNGEDLVVACEDDRLRVFSPEGGQDLSLPWGTRPRGALSDTLYTTALNDEGTLALVNDVLWVSRWRSPDGVGRLWRDGQTIDLLPDEGPDSDVDARGVPAWLGVVAARPDGRALVYGGLKANTERGLYNEDRAFSFDTITRAKLVHMSSDGDRLVEPLFDNRDRVGAMAYSTRGDQLAVAHFGTGVVDILDSYTMATMGSIPDVGLGLSGLLWVDDTLYVLAGFDRELVVYDMAGAFPEELRRVEVPAEAIALGQRVFYDASDTRMSAHGYMSCGSCHLDSASDNLTWDFTDRGEGLRNTSTMLGRAGAVPLHWTANFDEIQDFEKNIRESQGGTGFLSDQDYEATVDPLGPPKEGLSEELDALADYLRGLDTVPRSPYREANGDLPEGALRGKTLFVEAGCGSCHSGPDFSDSAFVDGEPVLYDIGTLTTATGNRLGEPVTGLDTPGLRGVHDTAPYLHDGSARTVRDAIRRMPGANDLNEDETDDLALYLLCLE